MATGEGCAFTLIEIDEQRHLRIALGSEGEQWWLGAKPPGECHDCGVTAGGIHHSGCDMEMCPACEGQLLSCGCLGCEVGRDSVLGAAITDFEHEFGEITDEEIACQRRADRNNATVVRATLDGFSQPQAPPM